MILNNLKIALRSLVRHRLYTLINILGMGFGITCFLFIALYAVDELTFDNLHKDADQIYRLVHHRQDPNEGEQYFGAVSFGASEAAKNEIASVENSVRIFMWGRAVIRVPETQNGFYQPFLTAENSFFQIFDFPFLAGNPATALAEPNSIVLTSSFSKKLFGDENPIGKIVRSDRGMNLNVTGLLEDIPVNSHLQFESLISHRTLPFLLNERVINDWSSQNWATYIRLQNGTDFEQIGNQLTTFAKTRAGEDDPFKGQLELQALSDIHFGSEGYLRELNEGKSTYTYLYLFGLIGFFILAIACINYINLATARSGNYSKEVGVRKTLGAKNNQLFGRFITESLLVTFIALLIGIFLTQLTLPLFNEFTNKSLTLLPYSNYWLLPALATFILFIGALTGSYPAAYLSRFNPSSVLKGILQTKKGGHASLRKNLVVLQFTLSILLIIGTIVVWQQMNYIQNKNLGFDKDQLIVVDINSGKVRNGFDVIRNGYEQLPDVASVSVSSRVPGEWKNLVKAEVRLPDAFDKKGVSPWYIGIDENFLTTFNINLISGRNFEPNRPADSSAVIINKATAKLFGIEEANEQEILVVSRINNGSIRPLDEPMRARVIGITDDFNFQSLYSGIEPLVLGHRNNPLQAIDYFTARLTGQNVQRTISQMTNILHSVDPEQLFEYHFLDAQIDHFYETDIRRGQLFTTAALCTIFIACLGLFGLATFMAEQKSKEIGIRKVLGASVSGIVAMLSKDFLKLVLIALFIAIPIASHYMDKWLESFSYRINIEWWVYVLSGLIAIGIAFITVGYQSIKAASANPVESMRNE